MRSFRILSGSTRLYKNKEPCDRNFELLMEMLIRIVLKVEDECCRNIIDNRLITHRNDVRACSLKKAVWVPTG